MEFELYSDQYNKWPSDGKHILANYDESTIIVYQAYKPTIANALVKNKNFHSDECIKCGYSLNRMSWIKTNFLWMMYRSGWATKKDQERIVAIRVKRNGFDEILNKSVLSSHDPSQQQQQHPSDTTDEVAEKNSIKQSDVVLQWDPDHKPDGSKVTSGRRAIQLGLRGQMLRKFSEQFIVDIVDITEFVREQYKKTFISNVPLKDFTSLLMPVEKNYMPADLETITHIKMTFF